MRSFTFFRKEIMENVRRNRLLAVGIVFLLMAILGPTTALLTPKLLEMVSAEMAANGLTLGETDITVMDSWAQFFKNLDIPLIVILIMWAGTFTGEYQKHTLIPLMTKGLSRTDVYVAKTVFLGLVWTVGYALYFGVAYGYNEFYWGNGTVQNIAPAVLFYWIFGLWLVSLIGFFSSLAESSGQVLLGVGGSFALCLLLEIVPKLGSKLPTALKGGLALMQGKKEVKDYLAALAVTLVLTAIGFVGGLLMIQKKDFD